MWYDCICYDCLNFSGYCGIAYSVSSDMWYYSSDPYLDLLLSIGWTVNFALPFTTNGTISIFMAQIFCSWADLPSPKRKGLRLFWMLCYDGDATFQYTSLSGICQGTLWNTMVDTGIISSNMKPQSLESLHDILEDDHIQYYSSFININLHQLMILLPNLTLLPIWHFTQLREFSKDDLQRMRHANRGLLLARSPVPLWTCMCSNVKTNLSQAWLVSDFLVSTIPQYFYLSSTHCWWMFFFYLWDKLAMTVAEVKQDLKYYVSR